MTTMTAAERVSALDGRLQTLRTLIAFSASPRINEPFRTAFYKMFDEQWTAFRAFAPRVLDGIGSSVHEPRFQDFIKSHDRWTQEYNARRLAGEPEHTYIGDELKKTYPPPASISDRIDDAIDDVTEPIRGALTGFGAGVLACALIAVVVAWKR